MNKHLIWLLALVALVGFVAPTQAAQLTVKDIPSAYDYTYDTPGFEAATGPDTFTATGKEILLIKNGTASDSTVTVESVADDLGRTKDISDSVPANGQVMVGPIQRKGFRTSAGTVQISYPDGTTSIEVAVIRLQAPF